MVIELNLNTNLFTPGILKSSFATDFNEKNKAGLFEPKFFENPVDVPFEDTVLFGSQHIKEYLTYRYGDYMKMPSAEQQKAAVHAFLYDTEKDFSEYIK